MPFLLLQKYMHTSNLLFIDEIPVSESEVQAWLDAVPTLSATKSRREAYRKAYNVEHKIRLAKLADNLQPQKPLSQANAGKIKIPIF